MKAIKPTNTLIAKSIGEQGRVLEADSLPFKTKEIVLIDFIHYTFYLFIWLQFEIFYTGSNTLGASFMAMGVLRCIIQRLVP